jgi:hypothetical protein
MSIGRIERGLAIVVAAIMAAMVLWPTGPRPDDLSLEIVSVQALPTQENHPQRVEVRVRWHWLRQARTTGAGDVLAIGSDPERWIVALPSAGVGANVRLQSLLERPQAWRGNWVNQGQGGEQTFVLAGRGTGQFYEASAITLHVHYMHEAPERFGWPGRSWVRTVSGTYLLDARTASSSPWPR